MVFFHFRVNFFHVERGTLWMDKNAMFTNSQLWKLSFLVRRGFPSIILPGGHSWIPLPPCLSLLKSLIEHSLTKNLTLLLETLSVNRGEARTFPEVRGCTRDTFLGDEPVFQGVNIFLLTSKYIRFWKLCVFGEVSTRTSWAPDTWIAHLAVYLLIRGADFLEITSGFDKWIKTSTSAPPAAEVPPLRGDRPHSSFIPRICPYRWISSDSFHHKITKAW